MMLRVVLATVMSCGLLWLALPAAAQPYCPNATHATSVKIPADLVQAVAKTFHIDDSAARNASFVRCAGSKLMGCYVGANLDCDTADTRRKLPGATAWCRTSPGSQIIPMSATGHDTIYEWTCKGGRAVTAKAVMHVDPRGYIVENWKEAQ